MQLIGIAIISTTLCLVIKKDRPEIANFIAYLMEFAIQLCKDCGEGNIASKLEFGGKIIVMSMSFPILLSIVEMVVNIIP